MKQFMMFQNFIASVKRGEKHIIFAKDYVVLSRKAYDSLFDRHPEFKSIEYDESSMNDWIKKRFLDDSKSEK